MDFENHERCDKQAAAPLESVRDITVASHLIGDLTGSTIDDPLSDRYNKLGCKVSPLDKDTDDYKMIVNYLEKTYEPVKVGDIVRCQPSDAFNSQFVYVEDDSLFFHRVMV